ncbi:hypothetical protein [Methylobacterium sp. CM6257]
MATINPGGLPPILATLLSPWLDAIEASEPGLGDHVMAIAEHCLETLQRRIELTPALEQAFVDARAMTDMLASAIDGGRVVPPWVRNGARGALASLAEALQGAEPNAITIELGLGW